MKLTHQQTTLIAARRRLMNLQQEQAGRKAWPELSAKNARSTWCRMERQGTVSDERLAAALNLLGLILKVTVEERRDGSETSAA